VVNLAADSGVLTADAVRLGLRATDKHDVISQCGQVLLELGAVTAAYLPAMHEREESVSTYVGEEVAIPHGTDAARAHVLHTRIAVLQFPDGVDWDGNRVRLAIPIAADGDQHVTLLSSLATILLAPGRAEELRTATDVAAVLELLHSSAEEMSA
jgi:mannitol/fructose-specific phosphotransferase system IIA component